MNPFAERLRQILYRVLEDWGVGGGGKVHSELVQVFEFGLGKVFLQLGRPRGTEKDPPCALTADVCPFAQC